jgi:hypothetical protein
MSDNFDATPSSADDDEEPSGPLPSFRPLVQQRKIADLGRSDEVAGRDGASPIAGDDVGIAARDLGLRSIEMPSAGSPTDFATAKERRLRFPTFTRKRALTLLACAGLAVPLFLLLPPIDQLGTLIASGASDSTPAEAQAPSTDPSLELPSSAREFASPSLAGELREEQALSRVNSGLQPSAGSSAERFDGADASTPHAAPVQSTPGLAIDGAKPSERPSKSRPKIDVLAPVLSGAPRAAEPLATGTSVPELPKPAPSGKTIRPNIASPASSAPPYRFWAQAGAFRFAENAWARCRPLIEQGFPLVVERTKGSSGRDLFFCRSLGPQSRSDAEAIANRLRTEMNVQDVIVVGVRPGDTASNARLTAR